MASAPRSPAPSPPGHASSTGSSRLQSSSLRPDPAPHTELPSRPRVLRTVHIEAWEAPNVCYAQMSPRQQCWCSPSTTTALSCQSSTISSEGWRAGGPCPSRSRSAGRGVTPESCRLHHQPWAPVCLLKVSAGHCTRPGTHAPSWSAHCLAHGKPFQNPFRLKPQRSFH